MPYLISLADFFNLNQFFQSLSGLKYAPESHIYLNSSRLKAYQASIVLLRKHLEDANFNSQSAVPERNTHHRNSPYLLKKFIRLSKMRAEAGAAMVATALITPVLLLLCVILFDLGRLYLNVIFVENMVSMVAKIAASKEPFGIVFDDSQLTEFVNHPSGENLAITARRQALLGSRLTASGAPHYSDRDKMTINLAYGALRAYNPRAYFPIPDPLGQDFDPEIELAGSPNCSIYFEFAPGHEPTALAGLVEGDVGFDTEILRERDRIYTVECAVPLFSPTILPGVYSQKYITINRSSYIFEAGDLCISLYSFCP